jgi:hypothetical protein
MTANMCENTILVELGYQFEQSELGIEQTILVKLEHYCLPFHTICLLILQLLIEQTLVGLEQE